MTPTWRINEELELNKDNLIALLNNDIPAIRIKNFATSEECSSFSGAVERAGLKYYSVKKKIGYIGMAQYEYRWGRPKDDYFSDVQEANKRQRVVFSESFDVIQRLIDMVTPIPKPVSGSPMKGSGNIMQVLSVRRLKVWIFMRISPLSILRHTPSRISALNWDGTTTRKSWWKAELQRFTTPPGAQ